MCLGFFLFFVGFTFGFTFLVCVAKYGMQYSIKFGMVSIISILPGSYTTYVTVMTLRGERGFSFSMIPTTHDDR